MEELRERDSLAILSLKHLAGPILLGRIFFVGLLLCALLVATICVVHAVSWVDKPFAGFLFYQFPGVGSFGDYEWPGLKAGVHYRDVIQEVDGRPISTGQEIEDILSRKSVGEEVRYLLDRQGRKLSLSVPVSVFTLQDFLKIFLLPFANGLVFWIIGIIVFVLKPDSQVSWVHLLFCLFVGTYLITGFELQSTSYPAWGYYVNTFAMAFFPAAALHLGLIFPERTRLIEKWPRLPILLYMISLVLFLVHALSFVAVTHSQPGSDTIVSLSAQLLSAVKFNRVYGLLGAIAIVSSSIYAFWRSSSVIARHRARVILLSSGVAFVPPTIMQGIVSVSKVVIPFNFTAVTVVVFPAAIGFAIARHNLFDVDVYIKRAVGYAIMTAVVGLTYFSVQTIISTFVLKPVFGAQAEHIYPIIFALLVVFFFNPVNRMVQEAVETLFFRKPYDYKATIASVSDALTTLLDLNAFVTKVIQTVRSDMFIDRAGVILLDTRKQECEAVFLGDRPDQSQEPLKDPCLTYDDPLLSLLAKERKLITKYDIAEDPRYAGVRDTCGQKFSELGASLALPLFYRDEFTGVFALGYKKSGHFYSREDIDLLKTVSSMTSTAIEQAREKGQRATLMQLFSKHVSPEVAESLWDQREQFLDGGRPRSQKLQVTVLFTDLQGFTGASEKMDPQVLMDWLNTYMESVAKKVMEHGGVVDDYFGDGVKVNFGVPLPRTTDAEISGDAVNAVHCALSLEQEMVRLNALMKERSLPTLRMRIGIFTGPVVAGSLGSADRMKYTTLGDTVNTASRLESFDKDLVLPHLATSPCRILIGESTLRHLHDQFDTQPVGEVTLKGKETTITAYCVLGQRSEVAKTYPSREGES